MKETSSTGTAIAADMSRRVFAKLSGAAGFTVASVVAGAGLLGNREAHAQTRNEEKDREGAAKYTMTIATGYRLGTNRTFPVMQLQLKENIQNATRGKVYVKLVPAGALGAGTELAQKVQAGTIQAAQHSMANFAPVRASGRPDQPAVLVRRQPAVHQPRDVRRLEKGGRYARRSQRHEDPRLSMR